MAVQILIDKNSKKIKTFFWQLFNWIYPNHCLLCHDLCQTHSMICHFCLPHLPWLFQPCYQCATSLPGDLLTPTMCGDCLKNPRFFDRALIPWNYDMPISKYITQLKFSGNLRYGKLLGSLLAEYLSLHLPHHSMPQCLIPMPLHPKRLHQRGFNQALEIARPISKQFNIPINSFLCVRNKNTLPQTKLSADKRQKNLNQAFSVTPQSRLPSFVAIIDDVMTTASTANELSSVLKQHGVERVEIWCTARAQIKI